MSKRPWIPVGLAVAGLVMGLVASWMAATEGSSTTTLTAQTDTTSTVTTATTASTLLAPPITTVTGNTTRPSTVTTVTTVRTTRPPVPDVTVSIEAEQLLIAFTDDLRIAAGAPPVAIDASLEAYARAWATKMAVAGVLSHSSIGDLLGEWMVVGENVGLGANASAVFDALVASPDHYQVMVDWTFTAGGVGAVIDSEGRLWVCQVFASRSLPPPTVPSTTLPTITVPSTTLPTVTVPSNAIPTVQLGTLTGYSVVGASTVTNTGNTSLGGSIGLWPGTSVTGFPPGTASTINAANPAALLAQTDLTIAYLNAAGRAATGSFADLGGRTLTGGVYTASGLTGTVTLDGAGDPGSVFIFKSASTLIAASNSRVVLVNGAQSCNVFWQVGSSATLGTGSTFAGTILALTSITVNTGVTINGRALARNGAVTLDSNSFVQPSC